MESNQLAVLYDCDMVPIYDALNYVSSCPWIINKKVWFGSIR